jgi:hypothetical protein
MLSAAESIGIARTRLSTDDLDAHLANGSTFAPRPDALQPIAGLLPIPSRTAWTTTGNEIKFLRPLGRVDLPVAADIDTLKRLAHRYTSRYQNTPIAVDLSGGLDSSIVIGLLNSLGLPLILIGHVSTRYEFRTERAIQQHYLDYPSPSSAINTSVLISDDDALPFSELSNVPVSAWPRHTNIYHVGHRLSAQAAARHGARVLLNGNGADALFCDEFGDSRGAKLPAAYQSWSLYDPWPDDTVYGPAGIRYIPAYAIGRIPAILYAMRQQQGEDVRKHWARNTFAAFIPRELRDYAYKADFDGWFIDGLRAAADEIRQLAVAVHAHLPHPELAPTRIEQEIERHSKVQEDAFERMLIQKISFMAWAYALQRNATHT